MVEDPPAWARTWAAVALLDAIPGIGVTRAERLLAECDIRGAATVGGITPLRRPVLVAALRRIDADGLPAR